MQLGRVTSSHLASVTNCTGKGNNIMTSLCDVTDLSWSILTMSWLSQHSLRFFQNFLWLENYCFVWNKSKDNYPGIIKNVAEIHVNFHSDPLESRLNLVHVIFTFWSVESLGRLDVLDDLPRDGQMPRRSPTFVSELPEFAAHRQLLHRVNSAFAEIAGSAALLKPLTLQSW